VPLCLGSTRSSSRVTRPPVGVRLLEQADSYLLRYIRIRIGIAISEHSVTQVAVSVSQT
jgi:hypothetical protein